MLSARSNCGTAAVLSIAILLQQLTLPSIAQAMGNSSQDGNVRRMSQTETLIAASFFGSGLTLMIASGFVENKYEKVTGYMDVGGRMDPIITTGGTDTEGMLIVGGALMFLGICFVFMPSSDDSQNSESSARSTDEGAGFKLALPSLDGQRAAIGIAYEF